MNRPGRTVKFTVRLIARQHFANNWPTTCTLFVSTKNMCLDSNFWLICKLQTIDKYIQAVIECLLLCPLYFLQNCKIIEFVSENFVIALATRGKLPAQLVLFILSTC